jgi:hypothetical protein
VNLNCTLPNGKVYIFNGFIQQREVDFNKIIQILMHKFTYGDNKVDLEVVSGQPNLAKDVTVVVEVATKRT